MVAVGGLGNIYGAVAGAVAILYVEQKLRDLGTQPDLFGCGTYPTQLRRCSRSASSG